MTPAEREAKLAAIRERDRLVCVECGGRGTLTRLGGDWGKTPDVDVPCWRCQGTGKRG